MDDDDSFCTYTNKQIAPALLFVAFFKICSNGPAEELMTPSISPATKSSTIRKMAPVKVPIPTQATMIFGPSVEAFGISVVDQSPFVRITLQGLLPSIICATASWAQVSSGRERIQYSCNLQIQ